MLPLDVFAREMGRLWTTALPADFPVGYRPNPPPGTSPPDLCAAVAVLLRIGLLAVDGFKVDGVTRTDFRPSQLGYLFIRNEEGLASNLYWPGGDNSGVTVGPGYDMGAGTREKVTSDLSGIGVANAAASAAAQGAFLTGEQASAFVRNYRDTLNLTLLQQQSLFDLVVPNYIDLVCQKTPKSLTPRLLQHEFDALLSLAWNLRRYGHYSFNSNIAVLDMVKADWSIKTLTGGGPGIPGRRVRESLLFTEATYHIKEMTLRNIDVEFYDDISSRPTRHG